MKLLITVLLCLMVDAPFALCAQTDTLGTGQQVDSIFSPYRSTGGPGCAVALIRHDRVTLEKTYGMASLEYRAPITASTVFDIGVLAKQFTGFAISSLVQEGQLSPRDDVRKFLPWVPVFTRRITIDNLIRHTGGVRD